jgi:hypothetical protein
VSDFSRDLAVNEAVLALQTIQASSTEQTSAWVGGLGRAVYHRPKDFSLRDLRAAILRAAPHVRGLSSGNLSKAAAVFGVFVHDGHVFIDQLAQYRQRDLYQAATLVLQGKATVDEALRMLADGAISSERGSEPAQESGGTPLPTPEPTPAVDPLVLEVYEAARIGAAATGQPVLEWVRQCAALALVAL